VPFKENEGLLPCPKEIANGTYLKPDQSISYLHALFLEIHSLAYIPYFEKIKEGL
jgi:hypothetical protein